MPGLGIAIGVTVSAVMVPQTPPPPPPEGGETEPLYFDSAFDEAFE